jgi:cell division protein ZapA
MRTAASNKKVESDPTFTVHMNTARSVTLDITILGREFKVACKENEREELSEAVALLDKRMREIRDAGKVTGTDRIAVMTALNFAHELLRERRASAAAPPPSDADAMIDGDSARRRIASMQTAIDQVLAGQEKLF